MESFKSCFLFVLYQILQKLPGTLRCPLRHKRTSSRRFVSINEETLVLAVACDCRNYHDLVLAGGFGTVLDYGDESSKPRHS